MSKRPSAKLAHLANTGNQDSGSTKSTPDVIHRDPALTRKLELLQLIETKISEAKSKKQNKKQKKRTKSPATRAESNRANSTHSTGPKTDSGKAKVSANALKTGFFANVDRLNPQDSPAYQDAVEDLRMGLHPDGPVEEQLIRELAMFRARLLRLEAAEYALICSEMETNTGDAREIAASFINNADALERLQKAEVHLRRAYNRTWDRLERMQKERLKMPLNEALKQSQIWATSEAIRTSCPKCTAAENGSAKDSAPEKNNEAWKKHAPPTPPRHRRKRQPEKLP